MKIQRMLVGTSNLGFYRHTVAGQNQRGIYSPPDVAKSETWLLLRETLRGERVTFRGIQVKSRALERQRANLSSFARSGGASLGQWLAIARSFTRTGPAISLREIERSSGRTGNGEAKVEALRKVGGQTHLRTISLEGGGG